MLKKYPQFSFGFAIVFAFELIAEANNLTWLIYITKPLITILLFLFILKMLKHKGRFGKRILAGLVFSLIGDSLLMFVSYSNLYFLLGLFSFFIAHACYIYAFYVDYIKKENVNRSYIWTAIMCFGIYCFSFYFYLRPYLGKFEFPVLGYSIIISIMATMAVSRINKVNKTSFRLVLIGALLFVVSDSLLAYFKFVHRIEYGGLLVMSTYMIAQFYITLGTVERKFLRKDNN